MSLYISNFGGQSSYVAVADGTAVAASTPWEVEVEEDFLAVVVVASIQWPPLRSSYSLEQL